MTAVHYIRRPDAVLIAAADRVSEHVATLLASHEAEIIQLQEVSRG